MSAVLIGGTDGIVIEQVYKLVNGVDKDVDKLFDSLGIQPDTT